MVGIMQNLASVMAGKKKYDKMVKKVSICSNSSNAENLNLLIKKEAFLYQIRKYRILKSMSIFLYCIADIISFITMVSGVVFATSEATNFSESATLFNFFGVIFVLFGVFFAYLSRGLKADADFFSQKLTNVRKSFREFKRIHKNELI